MAVSPKSPNSSQPDFSSDEEEWKGKGERAATEECKTRCIFYCCLMSLLIALWNVLTNVAIILRQLHVIQDLATEAGIKTKFAQMKRQERWELYNYLMKQKITYAEFEKADSPFDHCKLGEYVKIFYRRVFPPRR